MNPARRLEALFQGLANYERTRTIATDWSLDKMTALLAAMDRPATRARFVQVGGSKGKGTTVAYLESLARSVGLRTGAFVSPHLVDVTERVRIDGESVGAEMLADAMERVVAFAKELAVEPSFFEAITAAAVLIFDAEALDLVVLEVGLGGRLDATTAVPVDASILTHIELEHQEVLGDTVDAIAREKAFVMRPGKPVFAWPDPAVDELFREHAIEVGADWREVTAVTTECEDAHAWSGRLDATGEVVRLVDATAFERPAAVLALSCLRVLFPAVAFPTDPVPRPVLPGRFELFVDAEGSRWPLILDGAHTRHSCAGVAAEVCRRFPHLPVVVLFASAADKRWREALSAFVPIADRFFVTTVTGISGVPAADVAAWLAEQGKRVTEVATAAEGLHALEQSEAVRVVVGSFHLVGAVRAELLDRT